MGRGGGDEVARVTGGQNTKDLASHQEDLGFCIK